MIINKFLRSAPEKIIQAQEFEDATVGVHDGIYTCIVHHEGSYSSKECEVVIKDLCEDSPCKEHEICDPDYSTGTVQCTCEYGCPMTFAAVCSSRCELFWNECALEEQTCIDGKEREVASNGFCPNRVKPEIRVIDEDIVAELGEKITLTSGLVQDGTPMVTIHWVFYPENGTPTYLSAREDYELTVTLEAAGIYRITLMQCMEEDSAVENEYRLTFPATTTPTPASSTSTPALEPNNLVAPRHVCSVFPGGVLDDFNSIAHYYDLSCTHILAADLMPSDGFHNPWFIYGTFDEIDGKTALMSMTFYLGREIFEFQRGWIVVTVQGGASTKLPMNEGVPQEIGETGCSVVFADLHLQATCPHFVAFYDGLMSGHIKLLREAGSENLEKGRGNIGLCFDDISGRRPNWQVGKMTGKCLVDTGEKACEPSDDCVLAQPATVFDKPWTACGVGAEGACNELNCDGVTPTLDQQCALEQANRINCNLKLDMPVQGTDGSCPADPCEWMKNVVEQGCPQDHLPFVCP